MRLTRPWSQCIPETNRKKCAYDESHSTHVRCDCEFRSFHMDFRIESCLQSYFKLSIVKQKSAENFIAWLSGSLHPSGGLRHRPWAATRTLFAWAWPMKKDGNVSNIMSLGCSPNVKWHAQKLPKGEIAEYRSKSDGLSKPSKLSTPSNCWPKWELGGPTSSRSCRLKGPELEDAETRKPQKHSRKCGNHLEITATENVLADFVSICCPVCYNPQLEP